MAGSDTPVDDENVGDEFDEENGNGDDTVPQVELNLFQASVLVRGRSCDTLDDVETTARRLMDYLVDQAEALDEKPDDRGLG